MVNETKKYVWNGIEFPTEKEMHDYIFESLDKNNDIEVTTEALNKALDYNGLEFRNYVVCAVDLPNKLYIAGKGKYKYSFKQSEAKRFTLKDAEREAKFATLNGTHYWKAIKIDSYEFTRIIN